MVAAVLSFLASLCLTRPSFHCDSAPWLRTGGPRTPIIVGRASSASALASAARLRNSTGSGCFRPVILHFFASEFPFSLQLLRARSTSGRRRARLGPSASSRLTLTLSPDSWSSASVADFVPASPNKGDTVSRFRTVVLVNTSSTSPSSRKVAVLMPCGTLLFQPTKILAHCWMFQFIANARQTQAGHELRLSLGNKSCSACPEKVRLSQHDRFLSRHRSFAVVVDFVCGFRCIRPQTHRRICLVQQTSNTTFPSTNTLFDKTVCVWIVGSSCGVKDSVFSQPVVNCARKLSPFITTACRPSHL